MKWIRYGTVVCVVLMVGGCGSATAPAGEDQQASKAIDESGEVPMFEWDPYWPKQPLPNKWAVGSFGGIDVDSQDHVWVLHRPRTLLHKHEDDLSYPIPESECCIPAPAVIEFDQEGNLVQAWGGPGSEYEWPLFRGQQSTGVISAPPTAPATPSGGRPQINLFAAQRTVRAEGPPLGYPWPATEHTLFLDHTGHVWIGDSAGSHVLKMTRDGEFVMQVGRTRVPRQERGSDVTDAFNAPAGLVVDPATNELYVADGYANRRVIVFDADTGAYKRHWGAYGRPPDDFDPPRPMPFEWQPTDPKPQQFTVVHSVRIDQDGLVYVGDRNNSRIQVFEKDGTFIKEAFIRPTTVRGSVLDFVFSRDPEQRFVFVGDGRNDKVWILRRSDLQVIGELGFTSHWGGGFSTIHNLAVDSKNNLYVAESLEGKRAQRFLYKGLGPQTREYDEYGLER